MRLCFKMNLLLKTAISSVASLVIGCATVPSNNSIDIVKEKAQKIAEYVIQNNVANPRYEDFPPEFSDALIRTARTYYHSQELGNRGYYVNLLTINAVVHGMHIITIESDEKKNVHFVSLLDTFVDGSCDNGVLIWRRDGINSPLIEYSITLERGLKHKSAFQVRYEEVLDTLLSAYEKPQEKK